MQSLQIHVTFLHEFGKTNLDYIIFSSQTWKCISLDIELMTYRAIFLKKFELAYVIEENLAIFVVPFVDNNL